jgi:hypothetical protein
MDGRGTSDGRGWWRRFFESVLPSWVQAVAALITLGLGFAGGAAVASSRQSGTPATRTVTVTSTITVPRKAPPATAVYLSDLHQLTGDTPMRGDTQIGNQDFPHSIFYDNIPSNQSAAAACQNVRYTCQATDYSIASGRYHHFSAMLGVSGCDGDMANWSLSVDSVVVKSGTIAVNGSAQPISVHIPRGTDLELLASTSSFSGAACGGVNIVWGNAQLSY